MKGGPYAADSDKFFLVAFARDCSSKYFSHFGNKNWLLSLETIMQLLLFTHLLATAQIVSKSLLISNLDHSTEDYHALALIHTFCI
jgi:hypothetical protein